MSLDNGVYLFCNSEGDLFDDDSFEDGENDVYIIVDEVVFVELWVRKIVLYYKCV